MGFHSLRVEFIPHKEQRYNTAGDWFTPGTTGVPLFRISKMDSDYMMACLLHELVEWYLCQKSGITQEEVDRFDFKCKDDDPGLNPKAPYHKQHMMADAIERLFIQLCGASWANYEKKINKLSEEYEK